MQAHLLANQSTQRAKSFNRDKMLTTAIVATDKTTGRKIVDCRVYIGKVNSATTFYCSIWIYGEQLYTGLGKAGGGGYHKASAAMYEALHNAGWAVSEPISGCGDGAMRDAAVAVAEAAVGHDDIILTVID